MKTIKRIFIDDMLGLFKNFFALVIVIGICFLPALYAWFNIYSNWDPYGNTGALKLAAVSLDEGYTDDEGVYHNQGDTIIENLHENTAVDWQFVQTEKEAKEGVYSGKYYAAVVIDENFTYNMYNVFSEDIQSPSLIFYENQKKNPVATKISDTVVQTLQTNINAAFVEVVMTEVFSGAGELYSDMQQEEGVEGVLDKLKVLHQDLSDYQTTIAQVIAADEQLKNALEDAKTDTESLKSKANSSSQALNNTKESVGATQVTLNTYSTHVNDTLTVMQNTLDHMEAQLNEATLSKDAKATEAILVEVKQESAELTKLSNALSSAVSTGNTTLDDMVKYSEMLEKVLTATSGGTIVGDAVETREQAAAATVAQASKQVADLKKLYNSQVVPRVNQVMDHLQDTLSNTGTLLAQMGETFGNMTLMFDSLQGTIDSANVSLEKTNEALSYVNERIALAIEKAEGVDADEKIVTIIETLSGDPKAYAAFISSPVQVTTEAVYPVENYGSAVAPFYSTLAFWVGALILTAIIKVHPDKKKYPNATPTQLYFGRYVLYWLLGQLQALVIVLGDIYLLKIQCLNPGWFLLAASVIATTFTIFIYSLVVTWGDAGKALAVVIVVIQIAGSSGTYPIELLPEFFKKVYIFFPFPYAINAIRECLCGMYEMDYLKYLLQLGLFIVVALVIGLLVRIPFEELNHYMEKRMEETEMM